jgi:hypothetical protein
MLNAGDVEHLLKYLADKAGAGTPQVLPFFDDSAGLNLLFAFERYINSLVRGDVIPPYGNDLPLFVTPDPEVRDRKGFSLPCEFVLSLGDLRKMLERVVQLRKVYPAGLELNELRAFCVGAFRQFLFLDDDNHGRGELDLMQVYSRRFKREDSVQALWSENDGWPKRLPDRINSRSENKFCELYWSLFPDHMEQVKGGIERLGGAIQIEIQMHSQTAIYASRKGSGGD